MKSLNKAIALAILASASVQSHAKVHDLVEVYQMAQQQDAKMAQALAKYESDKQIKDLVKAALLPKVALQGSLSKTDSSLDSSDSQSSNVSLVLNQTLYQHDAWARYDQADYQLQTADYSLQSAEQDLILRVAETYFKVLLAEEDVTLAKAQEAANKTQWDRAKASAEVGLASRTDVLQAKSTYDISISDRINAEFSLDVALEEMTKLTGKSINSVKSLSLSLDVPKDTRSINDWEQQAQDGNLSVLSQSQQAFIASEEIEVSKAGYWPNVNLQASYGKTEYMESNNPFADDRTDLTITLSASVDLYSGGATTTQVSQARENYKAATQGLRDAKEEARLSARVLARNVEKGYKLVSALRAAVQSSEAFLEAAEEGHKVGLKSLLEVLSARTNEFKAKRDLASALQSLLLSKLQLEAAVGDLNMEDIQQFNSLLSSQSR